MTGVRWNITSSLPPAKSGGTYWTSLDLQMTPEGLWSLLADPYSGNHQGSHSFRIVFSINPLGTRCLHQLAELSGKRGHFAGNPIADLPSAGCCLSWDKLWESRVSALTWIDPGAGRPSKRQEDGCALGAQPREERGRVMEPQLVNEQKVSVRDLGRKANMMLQVSKA